MYKRVVITGMCPVTSIGIGKENFFNNLYNKNTNIEPLPDIFKREYKYKTNFYSPFPEINLEEHGIKTHFKSVLTLEDKITLIGIKYALEDAEYNLVQNKGGTFKINGEHSWDIVLGTGNTGLETAFRSNMAHALKERSELDDELGFKLKANRMVIPMTMPSSPAAWGSIFFGIKGTCYTLNASCASGTYGIGEAFNRIKHGMSERIITGGVENLKDDFGSVLRGFDMLGALTKSETGKPMPFDEKRSGFLFSEGGGSILILEDYEVAISRGANIYAEVVEFKSNADAHSIVQIDPTGELINSIFKDVSSKYCIDIINTHGTGTLLNDGIELSAIDAAFKERPIIQATKGILGHTIGASGAIEATVLAYSLKEGRSHGNLGGDIPQETTISDFQYGVSTSFGFGGHNGALVLKKI